ncbi:relaxase/mobilization nuclease domain-containing protein [Lysinibacillus xylanilyticus]|uniref:relaxase/mobilization nuclease domain-containing protein n=1 Tax=Lysinibacillus xylanilyticus TaxID=582475 RepID=UPI002E22B5E3|nr:relaxase/mobilization nuclease domain-containing protein [Lysinibacillus xylanilyticus]
MSIVKIQQVRSLRAAVKYSMQDYKTNEDLVTSFECDIETIERDFKSVLYDYNEKTNSNKDMSARMIIQSFDSDDNLTPEQAHRYGVELAENYLKGKHQFVVITHTETDNLHNHIIFNSINFEDLKMFDSKRQHTINDLRKENDKVSEEHGLKIIESGRSKGITFNEYVARAMKQSYKGKLEEIIDDIILKSNSFEEFLELMNKQGYESKMGKYLSFRNPRSNKFMRTKMLGMNYFESSIKYRIANKDYTPLKQTFIDKRWIDKSQAKFKNNKGLQKWATKQNINYLNEISSKLYKQDITLRELNEIEIKKENLISGFEKQLELIDGEIFKLEKMKECFNIYQSSYSLIKEYKEADDKMEFKQTNYSKFKQFDTVKRDINYLKKHYDVTDAAGLNYKLSLMTEERNLLYGSLGKDREKAKELEQAKTQRNQKNHENER